MGLRNLTFKPATVTIPGGESFTVRGLTPDLVLGLYDRHRGDLSDLFDFVIAKAAGSDESGDPASIVMELIPRAPGIVAELIAVASGSDPTGDDEEWEADNAVARLLPLPVQIDALMKIADQTFTSDMPPGKFLAVVVQMGSATAAVVASRKS